MSLFYITLTVHILAAAVWIGGMLFLSLVAVPALRGEDPQTRAHLFTVIGRQFRWVAWGSIAILISTGLLNLLHFGVGPDDLAQSSFWSTQFGSRLAFKAILITLMLILSAVHDFVLGPRSTALSRTGDPARAAAYRRRISWMARISVVLAILVVWASVGLAH